MFEFLKRFLSADKLASSTAGPQPPGQTTDPDEDLLASIKAYRERMFDAAESEIAANQRNVEGDKHKIERTERFLRESGLGRGIAKFMTTVWSTRNQAERASEANPLPGEHGMQLTGGGHSERHNEWITFLYGKHHYRAESRPKDGSSFDGDNDYRYGEGSLSCDGVEVLRVETEQHYNDEYFMWKYNRVLVFAKGDWIPEMVELLTQFEIEDRQFFPKLMVEAEKKQAGGISE
ncbi:MAG: hypothetical protein CAF45_010985 [Nitrospira sp. CG24E]|nr:MAG: hypothetical protein CAF45_010985 [Nitrospira sp. CG24E]